MRNSEKIVLNEMMESGHKLKIAARGLSIGQMIEMIRHQLGMSQKILAKLAGVPQTTISRLESSKTTPNLSTLKKVLNAIFCDIVIVPVLKESIDSIRRKQARKIAERQVKYLQGTMSLEKQESDPKLIEELIKEKEEELFRSRGSKLWEEK